MQFKLNTSLLIKILFIGLLLVISINYITIFLFYKGIITGGFGYKMFSLLTVDFENSLPTYFNALLILIAFFILAIIALHHKNMKSVLVYNWLLLTLAFLLLSLDENPSVHNFFVSVISSYGIRQKLDFSYAWGMPFGAIGLLFIFFLIRFTTTLPKTIARGFVVSGVIYVSGAIFIGMYGTRILNIRGFQNIKYALVASYEESLEMIGLTLFIYFLLEYIRIEFKSLSLEVN